MSYLVKKTYKCKHKKNLIHVSYYELHYQGVSPRWNVFKNAYEFSTKKSAEDLIKKIKNKFDKNTTYETVKN